MDVLRNTARRVPGLRPATLRVRRSRLRSGDYWEDRYRSGGNSGAGSYGDLALYKASFLNDFVKDNGLSRVTEFGCGDGAQLLRAVYSEYIGLDVAPSAVELCTTRFEDDKSKAFFLYSPKHFSDPLGVFAADLCLSLDVVYHLVEDAVFDRYMRHLFGEARRYVIIYSSNDDGLQSSAAWIRHRRYTDWIEEQQPDWELCYHEENPFASSEVFAAFRVFRRTEP
jgi:hypothetical protein